MNEQPINARDAVLLELGAYYEVDDLPENGPIWGDKPLAVIAAGHARIILLRAGEQIALEAASLLRETCKDRYGSFVREIVAATRYGWMDEDEDWAMMRQLMLSIADALEAR